MLCCVRCCLEELCLGGRLELLLVARGGPVLGGLCALLELGGGCDLVSLVGVLSALREGLGFRLLPVGLGLAAGPCLLQVGIGGWRLL